MTPRLPDDDQRRVLDHGVGPLLVTGAPGTGKSTVLRERFLHLVERGEAERVALIVGSRRARDEGRNELLSRISGSQPVVHIVTIHGLAFDVVGRRYGLLGYEQPPTVLSAQDQFERVQELLDGEDPADWPAFGSMLRMRGFADELRQFLLRAQEALRTPEDIERRAAERELTGWREVARFAASYLRVLDSQRQVDFAGLVEQAAAAAAKDEPLFDHLLVDDYHDTTYGAEALIAALRPSSLVVAGDAGSHIFSFQGTTLRPLEHFHERFPGAGHVQLAADHRGAGRTIEAVRAMHTSEEHATIARELRRVHVHDDVPWGSLAVVVRRENADLAGLLRALDDAGVPRHAPRGAATLRAEPGAVPYLLALEWIAFPGRRDDLVESVLTSELGALSPAAARTLLRMARQAKLPRREAIGLAAGLDEDEAGSLRALHEAFTAAEPIATSSALECFRALWSGLPCAARLVAGAETDPGSARDLDAVLALTRVLSAADESPDRSVAAFLERLDRGEGGPESAAGSDDHDAVHVLTAHAAAGREFDTVVVAGLVEGNFPSLRRPEPMFDLEVLDAGRSRSDRNRIRLADERRLFDVVTSRARRRVVLTAGDPHGDEASIRSRFADEIGVAWRDLSPAGIEVEPASVDEAAARWRRELADTTGTPAARLAGLAGLVSLGVDPTSWWFLRDWTDADGAPDDDPLHLSYSRLEKLENCGLQYVLSEELGLSRGGGHQAWVGTTVHSIIEDCENGKLERSLPALVDELRRRWREGEFPSKAVSDGYRQVAEQRMLPNWFDDYGPLPATESEVEFRFDHEGAHFRGFIDRIGPLEGGGNRITDFKSGKGDNAPKPGESLQLGIYYLAVQQAEELARFRPVRAVELAYLSGTFRRPRPTKQVAWPVSPAGEEEYQQQMRDRVGGLIGEIRERRDEEAWRPSTRANCFFCDFRTLCSLYPEGRPVFDTSEQGASSGAVEAQA
ncbi:MAG: ATP-dependent DNA helicase [Actinomycetota bacterium]